MGCLTYSLSHNVTEQAIKVRIKNGSLHNITGHSLQIDRMMKVPLIIRTNV